MVMRRTAEQLLEAYVDANHELVNALATIKQAAANAVEGIAPLDAQYIYDVASGKLEVARKIIG
jgi:hypothetical protein